MQARRHWQRLRMRYFPCPCMVASGLQPLRSLCSGAVVSTTGGVPKMDVKRSFFGKGNPLSETELKRPLLNIMSRSFERLALSRMRWGQTGVWQQRESGGNMQKISSRCAHECMLSSNWRMQQVMAESNATAHGCTNMS